MLEANNYQVSFKFLKEVIKTVFISHMISKQSNGKVFGVNLNKTGNFKLVKKEILWFRINGLDTAKGKSINKCINEKICSLIILY